MSNQTVWSRIQKALQHSSLRPVGEARWSLTYRAWVQPYRCYRWLNLYKWSYPQGLQRWSLLPPRDPNYFVFRPQTLDVQRLIEERPELRARWDRQYTCPIIIYNYKPPTPPHEVLPA